MCFGHCFVLRYISSFVCGPIINIFMVYSQHGWTQDCLFVCLYAYSQHKIVCLYVCLPTPSTDGLKIVCLFVCLYAYSQHGWTQDCLFVCLFVCLLPVRMDSRLFVCLFVCMPTPSTDGLKIVCLFVCLYAYSQYGWTQDCLFVSAQCLHTVTEDNKMAASFCRQEESQCLLHKLVSTDTTSESILLSALATGVCYGFDFDK